MKNEDFLKKLKNTCPDDEELERAAEIYKLFDNKNGEELTQTFFDKRCNIISWCFWKKYWSTS